jgi:hypothetical protein
MPMSLSSPRMVLDQSARMERSRRARLANFDLTQPSTATMCLPNDGIAYPTALSQ